MGCHAGHAAPFVFFAFQHLLRDDDKLKLDAYVHGLRTTSLTSSAVAAGFRYVDGNSVRSLADAPREVQRYSPADLYAKLLQERSR